MRKKIFLIASVLFFYESSFAGHETHGGNVVLQEFHSLREELNRDFDVVPSFLFSPNENFKTQWQSAGSNTEVVLREKLLWNGFEVIAINHPSRNPPLVEINESLWRTYSGSISLRQIVIHEYLPIMGILDGNYETSEYLVNLANAVRRRSLINLFKVADQEQLFLSRTDGWKIFLSSSLGRYFQNSSVDALSWMAGSLPHGNILSEKWLVIFEATLEQVPRQDYGGLMMSCVFERLNKSNSHVATAAKALLKRKGITSRLINKCPTP
ncbi:MAG: hypothetical protein OM95_03575 [Bdellovibrio sp. ArHS]|uniref:hypothetical protein n=1 Tax=Bdellovibrio sp. ArHS TaxID=1569284 RepID=UPI000582E90F|nr:hypothetical protein [Bdellovibrio sp. ArHS]KHD89455.1 MAG: hypothetical protein OM95_03575 [Bdellovibrio sp. ArHS]